MSDLPGYDAWRTGGNYSKRPVDVECLVCGETWEAIEETEYGTYTFTPGECLNCGEDERLLAWDPEPPEPSDDF